MKNGRVSPFLNFLAGWAGFSLHFPFICIFEDASLTRSWVLLRQANSHGYSLTCVFSCAVPKTEVVCVYSIIFSLISPSFSLHLHFWGRIVDPLLGLIMVVTQSRLLSNMFIWLCSAKNRSRLRSFYHLLVHFPLRFSLPFSLSFSEENVDFLKSLNQYRPISPSVMSIILPYLVQKKT